LILFIFFQNTLHSDIEAGITNYSNTLLEIFLVVKTHVLLNLIVRFVINFIITKHFNIPQPTSIVGLVTKSALLGVLAGSALSYSATSTTVDPGDGWGHPENSNMEAGFYFFNKRIKYPGESLLAYGGVPVR